MTRTFRRSAFVAAAALTLIVAGRGHGITAAEAPLKVGMIPDAGATQVSVEEKAPLQAYLAKALGRPVALVIPTNYNATVEGLGNGSLDFAYLGGLTYVKAHASYGVVPLVQRDIDQQFHSLLITQSASSIHTIADLKGKRFAFGDINSTSGHLMAYRAMTEDGIDPDKSLQSYRYTGSHAATVQAVASGVADAGATDETVFKSLIADGKVDGSKLRVFYTTPAFVDYVWVARKDVDVAAQKKFADTFLGLTAGRDDQILTILRGQRFVRANNAEYQSIVDVAKRLGLF
ncbi:MAG TPA: phosphate/phosphite/phosphonate ABC transporter substrate-binding protein [Vicinamibacterales bacterium]|nr:phosphate/phosphite/phosphonate ABC transporter substrate-binding protein [Vicinamibacterales bacterium]